MMDQNSDSYIDYKEFVTGLLKIYCSSFDQKTKFVFDIYDFDGNGLISKDDISALLQYMPIAKNTQIDICEGKFTQEGGGAKDYKERYESIEQMFKILDICFGSQE